jgi:hypothetical protein
VFIESSSYAAMAWYQLMPSFMSIANCISPSHVFRFANDAEVLDGAGSIATVSAGITTGLTQP